MKNCFGAKKWWYTYFKQIYMYKLPIELDTEACTRWTYISFLYYTWNGVDLMSQYIQCI